MGSKANKKWYKNNHKIQCFPKNPQSAAQPELSLWDLYFKNIEENSENHLRDINQFLKFIEGNKKSINFTDVDRRKCLFIDYKNLISDEELSNTWPNLKEDLVNNTEYCMNCIGFAVHTFLLNEANNTKLFHCSEKNKYFVIRVGLLNYDVTTPLKDIKVNYHYGKLVSVRGTVIKASNVKIIAKSIAFCCNICNETQLVEQLDFNYTLPSKCTTSGCKAKHINFQPLYSSNATKTCKLQIIKIQEKIGIEKNESGGVPRTLECQLIEDLVKSCIPGDDVTIIGVIKIQNSNNCSSKNKNSSVFSLFLNAHSIINNKTQSANNSYGNSERTAFNLKDYYCIQEIHSEPKLFRLLVQSLCPNIYGHEVVKAGLILALFGGTRQYNCRAESHVLMVGDPGLGKSQMLKACSNVSPKSIYVCGNTSTTSGLTVTMTREAGGEYVLEAGALMLADQGCCCIDEFDKMPTQHACLLEAMQQQSISIAKAGVVSTLPARTTILAAANPVGGHYNKSKTIAENLKICSPMLSRFDLIFILLDQPNQDLDKLLTKHVIDVHYGKSLNNISNDINQTLYSSTSETTTLRSRLIVNHGESLNLLPPSILRKYIMYAQKYVNPTLTDEAKNEVIKYYTHLRNQFKFGDSAPVTTRQLNSLIRLTQARAKCELREEATVEDALDVIEIVKHSLIDIFTDEFGVMDTTRSQNSSGLSSKNQAMKLLKILQQNSEASSKSIFTLQEIREFANRIGLDTKKFYDILNSLNIHGFLLNKGQNKYQLVSAYL